ncbi:MAG: hypothetical protein Q8Q80_07845 [Methyloversatilis sp.]|uniref:hypothetical protein n=1 Tax=Methyloversatilis sp. TaxID=2569862 RepID=UPI0027347E94|nr:hypothetical protein [Methyloversatilis sp.]MDP3872560.1 hypothetical protein [Methyloversatilis sp.]
MGLSALALRTRWSVARLRHGPAGAPLIHPGRATAVAAMGLHFPSPLLLAAGFDRHGRLFDAAARLGLGGVEAGSMNCAADGPAPPLLWSPRGAVRRGLSLNKPAHLAWPQAQTAFLHGLATWHRSADYITVNPGHDCPGPAALASLMSALARLKARLPRPQPLALVAKLPARWLGAADRRATVHAFIDSGCDGLLLSTEGAADTAADCIAEVAALAGQRFCLISVGGVASLGAARQRLAAGAHLVQVHRALARRLPPHFIGGRQSSDSRLR